MRWDCDECLPRVKREWIAHLAHIFGKYEHLHYHSFHPDEWQARYARLRRRQVNYATITRDGVMHCFTDKPVEGSRRVTSKRAVEIAEFNMNLLVPPPRKLIVGKVRSTGAHPVSTSHAWGRTTLREGSRARLIAIGLPLKRLRLFATQQAIEINEVVARTVHTATAAAPAIARLVSAIESWALRRKNAMGCTSCTQNSDAESRFHLGDADYGEQVAILWSG